MNIKTGNAPHTVEDNNKAYLLDLALIRLIREISTRRPTVTMMDIIHRLGVEPSSSVSTLESTVLSLHERGYLPELYNVNDRYELTFKVLRQQPMPHAPGNEINDVVDYD